MNIGLVFYLTCTILTNCFKNTYFVLFTKKVVFPKFMSVVLHQWMSEKGEGCLDYFLCVKVMAGAG